MKTSHIWRNCLIKEMNIPFEWKNQDCNRCNPKRQDVFLVYMKKSEVEEFVFDLVADIHHIGKVSASIAGSEKNDYAYIISRDLSYVQFYPYVKVDTKNSPWEQFAEHYFNNPIQIRDVELNIM